MDNAQFVRRFKGLGDLRGDRHGVDQRHRTRPHPIGQRRPFDQLEHQRVRRSAVFEAVNLADVRMIERREQL